jgi:hypothetical protein
VAFVLFYWEFIIRLNGTTPLVLYPLSSSAGCWSCWLQELYLVKDTVLAKNTITPSFSLMRWWILAACFLYNGMKSDFSFES